MTRGIEHIGNDAEKQRPLSINRIEFEILVTLATDFRIGLFGVNFDRWISMSRSVTNLDGVDVKWNQFWNDELR
ncbi:hypothetical protein F511_24917 [Dorcoceras hygrometricum]|uniref:Uncharacterized protein n=1 Tax=Dorcoceras hygrometricum TaxID=472368 RepID=A0A2Z7CRK9_9LAMI|nr:hypothetical protein F511_24917 [Dorcoceras hygrometricum]